MTNAIGAEASDPQKSAGLVDDPNGASLGAIAAIARAVRSGTGLLAGLLDRIVNGIRGVVAPVILSIGLGAGAMACESTEEPVAVEPPALKALPPAKLPRAENGPRQLGQFSITFYYVIGEDEIASKPVASNDNRSKHAKELGKESDADARDDEEELASVTSDQVTLYGGGNKCEPIADVSKEFASQLTLQGTGKLRDGRVLNIWGACNCKHSPCFNVTQAQWGTAGSGKSLQPFRTVAVDPKVVKLGSLLYVPLLEGRTMPGRPPWGGYVHDGCVIADDTGGHISGNRIDLFVGRKGYFLGLSGSGGSHAWARHVPVYDGTEICERKGRRVGKKSASI